MQPFWIYQEPAAWPWCNLAASQKRPYCASVNSHSPVGLVSRQWDTTDWASVLCDRRIHNDRASRSASSWQCACPFYSYRAGIFGKASHHPGLSAPLQPRFRSLPLLAFPKVKIALESEEICECDGHTVHKRLTADWLASRESDCSRIHRKVSFDRLPSYIKATPTVLKIIKMAGYSLDSPRNVKLLVSSNDNITDWQATLKETGQGRRRHHHHHHWRLMSHAITGAQPTTEQKKCSSGAII